MTILSPQQNLLSPTQYAQRRYLQNKRREIKKKSEYYIGVGLCLGVAFGVVFNNIGLGIYLGLVFGVAMQKKHTNN